MNFDFRFYFQRFLRRLPYFIVIAAIGAAVGLTLAKVLPPVYRAEARLLVESPQIPDELAASTVNTGAPEALQIIQQRLLTRANLLELAQRLNVYEGQAQLNPDKIVEDMRRRIAIVLPDSRAAADFVTVSFAAPSGQLSAQVTNEFVTLILQENVALRTATAGQTLDFFQQEVDRLGTELGQLGAKILEYKLQNKDALPDSLDYRRARQASQQERLLQIERDLASLGERRQRLVEIYESTGDVAPTTAPRSAEEQQLRQLQDQLANALLIYSPQHPNVTLLQGKIALLEETVRQQVAAPEGGPGDAEGTPVDPADTAFDLQLADIDSQISFGADQKRLIEAELVELKASIDATPGNAIELDSLQRDYDNVQMQYNNAVARLGQAATGDRIEALSKGQRITVIEQAVVPDEPASPNRQLIAAGGIGGGIALGLGFILLLEMLNRTIHRPVDISARLGIQTFATIPYIRTRQETVRRRLAIAAALLVGLVGVPAALFAVHQYYLPLDLLIGRVLDKI